MYYCIAIIVLIGSLFYVNIKHSDELSDFDDAFGIYALCVLVSVAWPTSLIIIIVVAVVYFLNLCVKKIIDVLNLK
jgi:chromate transport protein ChrA